MSTLVECVPNFSEGRDEAKVDAIVDAMKMGAADYIIKANNSAVEIIDRVQQVLEKQHAHQ